MNESTTLVYVCDVRHLARHQHCLCAHRWRLTISPRSLLDNYLECHVCERAMTRPA
jgi:hypothetical protein